MRPRQFGQQPRPSSYFIRLPDAKKTVDYTEAGHERVIGGKLGGRMVCLLTVNTLLHVGTGMLELSGRVVHKEIAKTPDGQPFIPGSSLKGVVRSIAEAVTASCLSVTIMRPGPLAPCKEPEEKPCPCCSLFGMAGLASRVSFSDALPRGQVKIELKTLPPLWGPRTEAPRYFSRGQLAGRKFYYHSEVSSGNEPWEVIAPRAKFVFTLEFHNLIWEEVHLLFFSLGCLEAKQAFDLKLGGGKGIGLGSVKVKLEQLELLQAGEILDPQHRIQRYREEDLHLWVKQQVLPHDGLLLGTQKQEFLRQAQQIM